MTNDIKNQINYYQQKHEDVTFEVSLLDNVLKSLPNNNIIENDITKLKDELFNILDDIDYMIDSLE